MTITEATNDVLKYFRENDWATVEDVRGAIFNLTQYKKTISGPEAVEVIKKTYEAAFKKLTALGVCESIGPVLHPDGGIVENSERWVLLKPLDYWTQQIELDGVLCVSIAQVLNDLAKFYDGHIGVDASKITHKDLENLTIVGYQLLSQLKGENGNDQQSDSE